MGTEGGFGRHVMAGFGAVLVLLAASALGAVYAVRQVADTQAMITRQSIRAAAAMQELRYTVERRLLAVRGYLLTRDPEYLDDLRHTRAEFQSRVETLRRDATSPPIVDLLAELEWTAAAMTDVFDDLVGQIQNGASTEATRATIEQRLIPVAARMQDQVTQLSSVQDVELEAARRRSEAAAMRAQVLTMVLAGVAVLLGATLGWVLTRTLTGAYRQAQDAAAHLRLVLDTVGDGIFGVDPEGRCTFANQACVGTLGVSGEEALLGRNVHDVVHRDSPELDDCGVQQALTTGRAVHRYDEVLRRPDGEYVPIEVSAVPVWRDRQVTGAVVTFRDISERKRLEALRREAETMRAREEFLAMASHDLKSPLAAAKLNVESLLRSTQAGRLEPGRAVERLRAADRILDGMAYAIRDLLATSRLSAGALQLDRRDTDLVTIAREVVERLREVAGHARCTVTIDAPAPVVGSWDRAYLEHAVANLVSNALKFGAGRPVDVSARAEDGTAILSVRDRGPGIAPDEQASLFERYGQTDTGRNASGHGLGLWIARRVVEAHGGSIGLDSVAGQGATFTIRLPRS